MEEPETVGADRSDRPLTVKETAQRLGMSETFIYDHSAEIGAIRYGRSIRFPVEVVEEYLRRMQRDR